MTPSLPKVVFIFQVCFHSHNAFLYLVHKLSKLQLNIYKTGKYPYRFFKLQLDGRIFPCKNKNQAEFCSISMLAYFLYRIFDYRLISTTFLQVSRWNHTTYFVQLHTNVIVMCVNKMHWLPGHAPSVTVY